MVAWDEGNRQKTVLEHQLKKNKSFKNNNKKQTNKRIQSTSKQNSETPQPKHMDQDTLIDQSFHC